VSLRLTGEKVVQDLKESVKNPHRLPSRCHCIDVRQNLDDDCKDSRIRRKNIMLNISPMDMEIDCVSIDTSPVMMGHAAGLNHNEQSKLLNSTRDGLV
jgi:hypothetical protein